MNDPKYIIVHCSDSKFGNARVIDRWHKEKGWDGIGYHYVLLNGHLEHGEYVITMEGAIECGRPVENVGAHCTGYNDRSIGICLIGIGLSTFVPKQFDSLKELCREMCIKFHIPSENVLGHCETESGKEQKKSCPNFDVSAIRTWLKGKV